MGDNVWVANASPLILLGKAGYLDLLAALADTVVVPPAVVGEVGAKPDGAAILAVLADSPVYQVAGADLCADAALPAAAEVLAWDLGAGETQVITRALRHGADRVVLDDLEARRCAKALGLGVIGTLGVVGRAKAMGRIAQAAPVIERLRRSGLYVSDALVEHLLREVGE